jgi:hypothetical protein
LPRQQWTLNVREQSDDALIWSLEGLLKGAPAARVRSWSASERPVATMPAEDLAWLTLPAWDRSNLSIEEAEGGRLRILASGSAARGELLVDGAIPVPTLPAPAPARAADTAWPYARDASLFRVDLLESWVFLGTRSGGTVQDGARTTPFWQVDSLASWSGPVFTRRTQMQFTRNQLAASAAVEVERYVAFVTTSLGGVRAP